MKKLIFAATILCVVLSCSNNQNPEEVKKESSELHKLDIPEGYNELIASEGDLDGDGIAEKVIVFDTDRIGDMGTEREIYICKKENDEWMLWKIAHGPVLSSESGGVMGDPFNDMVVDKDMIYISHMGGSMEKWYYNHNYKYIDSEFRLVSAVVDYGINCVQWETYQYSLEYGKLLYDLSPEKCEDVLIDEYVIETHEEYDFEITDLPLMDGFVPGDNELKLPDDGGTIYY